MTLPAGPAYRFTGSGGEAGKELTLESYDFLLTAEAGDQTRLTIAMSAPAKLADPALAALREAVRTLRFTGGLRVTAWATDPPGETVVP